MAMQSAKKLAVLIDADKKRQDQKVSDIGERKNMKTYNTTGTCSRAINYEVVDGVVTKCEFVGGCPGNTQGVARLVVGRKVEDVIATLKGIQCRNGTSCPDQLARALEIAQ